MDNKLDSHVGAHKGENLYDFDNEILLNWYPQRIIMNSKETGSVLELGLGHGFSHKHIFKFFRQACGARRVACGDSEFQRKIPGL